MNKTIETDRKVFKKKGKLIPFLIITVTSLIILSIVSFFVYKNVKVKILQTPSISKLKKHWSEYDYLNVYETSTLLLQKKSLNKTVLVYRGYAAYYLAVSETDPSLAQTYIDEAIRALRIALMNANDNTISQIKYVLGKAYFYKNIICSYHYYADLVVKYLEEAKALGYKANDIPEYLGISYGQLNKPYESIARFSESLLIRESDSLLLSIAEQYYKLGQYPACKQYLFQVVNDDILLMKAQILLGRIYLQEEKIEDAQKMFEAVLEKNSNDADANYLLGVIYEKNNNMVKARAQWRKTLKIDSTYEDAIKKMYR